MFARCSQETIYLRFHVAWPTVPEWAIGLLVGAGDVDLALGLYDEHARDENP
jgi:hypothetical protein